MNENSEYAQRRMLLNLEKESKPFPSYKIALHYKIKLSIYLQDKSWRLCLELNTTDKINK